MKKIITIIFSLLLLVSCNTGKQIIKNTNYEYNKQYARTLIVTKAQLDSIFVADTLPSNFKEWYSAAFVDYETNKSRQKHYYGKQTIEKRVYYILSPYDKNKFKLIIRTETNEE